MLYRERLHRHCCLLSIDLAAIKDEVFLMRNVKEGKGKEENRLDVLISCLPISPN